MNSSHYRSKPSAVTLVELVAAIAIVALLTTIAFGAFGRFRETQRSTTCVSNLRQIGLAMTLYTSDNNFRLPGPLWRGQSPVYQADAEGQLDVTSGNLINILVPYLNLKTPSPGQTLRAEIFSCPAWESEARPETETVCYYSTGEIQLSEDEIISPFGHPGSEDPESAILPAKVTQLPNPAGIAALWEFDKHVVSEGFYVTDPRVPREPVHHTVRNVLYFDAHVAPQPVTF